MRHSQQMAIAWQLCEEFNAKNPVGTFVIYRTASERKHLRITAEAFAVAGKALVAIEGRPGGVGLETIYKTE